MNTNIIGRQVTVSDDMKEFVEKKLAKFDRYFPRGADAAVTFRKVGDPALRPRKRNCRNRRHPFHRRHRRPDPQEQDQTGKADEILLRGG